MCTFLMLKDIFIVPETAERFPKLHYVIIASAAECVHSGVKEEPFPYLSFGRTAGLEELKVCSTNSLSHTQQTALSTLELLPTYA